MGIEGSKGTPNERGNAGAEAARILGNMESSQSVGGASGEITNPDIPDNQPLAGSREGTSDDPSELKGMAWHGYEQDLGSFDFWGFISDITEPQTSAEGPSEAPRGGQGGPRVNLRQFILDITAPEQPADVQHERPAPVTSGESTARDDQNLDDLIRRAVSRVAAARHGWSVERDGVDTYHDIVADDINISDGVITVDGIRLPVQGGEGYEDPEDAGDLGTVDPVTGGYPRPFGEDFDQRFWGRRFDPPWERDEPGHTSGQPSNATASDIAGATGVEQEFTEDVVIGQGAVYTAGDIIDEVHTTVTSDTAPEDDGWWHRGLPPMSERTGRWGQQRMNPGSTTGSESHRENVTAQQPERPTWFKGVARSEGTPRPAFVGIRDARPFNEQEATWLIADYLAVPPEVVSLLAQEIGQSSTDILRQWDGGPARDLPGISVNRPQTAGQRVTAALDEYLRNAARGEQGLGRNNDL